MLLLNKEDAEMANKQLNLSKEKQTILKTLYLVGAESILVREGDGAVIITRSLKGGVNGTTLGKRRAFEDKIDESYLFPELLELEGHSSLLLTDLIEEHCPDVN